MKEIELSAGFVAIVDDEDFEEINKYKWYAKNGGQSAVRDVVRQGKKTTIYMHRALLNPPKDFFVDHINRNPLDNRRSNLRLANKSQNMCNRGAQKNNTSGFKGVIWHSDCKKPWLAKICINRKHHSLGMYATAEEAHEAYLSAAAMLHGEFAFEGENSEET